MAALASIVPASDPGVFALAARRLLAGKLVAFPTETVYGLGALATDPEAVHGIFAAKGRPLTDPVIMHTTSLAKAEPFIALSESQRRVATALAERFWPGPLTLVVPANRDRVPDVVSAGTGFVGVRCPAHPVAQKLLEEVGAPVAAPSANRFGHTSPTVAAHVMHDLEHCDVVIVDGGACTVGIESSIAKIGEAGDVAVLRRGAVSVADIEACLRDGAGIAQPAVSVVARKAGTSEAQVAPGQMLTHYAPAGVDTFLVAPADAPFAAPRDGPELALGETVLVDFGGSIAARLSSDARSQLLATRDLAADGDPAAAAVDLFAALRWTETIAGAKSVLLPCLEHSDREVLLAVHDRLFRAASGRLCAIADSSHVVPLPTASPPR